MKEETIKLKNGIAVTYQFNHMGYLEMIVMRRNNKVLVTLDYRRNRKYELDVRLDDIQGYKCLYGKIFFGPHKNDGEYSLGILNGKEATITAKSLKELKKLVKLQMFK